MANITDLEMISAGLGGLSRPGTVLDEVTDIDMSTPSINTGEVPAETPVQEVVEEVQERPVSVAGLDALLKIFGETQYQVDLTEKEIDWLIDKAELFKTLVDHAIGGDHPMPGIMSEAELRILSHRFIDVLGQPGHRFVDYNKTCNAAVFGGLSMTSKQVLARFPTLSESAKIAVIPDRSYAPFLSIVLGHTDRFTVRLDIEIDSSLTRTSPKLDCAIVVKANKLGQKAKETNRLKFAKEYDEVTMRGYELLMEDEKGRAITDRDIIDVHLCTLQAQNPAYFSVINRTSNKTDAIAFTVLHQGGRAVIREFNIDISSVVDILQSRRATVQAAAEEDLGPMVGSSAWDSLSSDDKDKYSKIREARDVRIKTENVLLNGSYAEILQSYRQVVGPQLIGPAVASRLFSAALQLPFLRDRQAIISDVVSTYVPDSQNIFTIYRGGIQLMREQIKQCMETDPALAIGDYIMYGADSNDKAEFVRECEQNFWSTGSNPTVIGTIARCLNERISRQMLRILLRGIQHPYLEAIYTAITTDRISQDTPEINEKLANVLASLIGDSSLRENTIKLFRLGHVNEVERDDFNTQRYVVMHHVGPSHLNAPRPVVLAAQEGSPYYNFIDEDRYAVAVYSKSDDLGDQDTLIHVLLLDNLANFAKQAQGMITSAQAGAKMATFLKSHTPTRGALSALQGPRAWGFSAGQNSSYLNDNFAIHVTTKSKGSIRLASVIDACFNSSLGTDIGIRRHILKNPSIRPPSISQNVTAGAFCGLDSSQIGFYMNRYGAGRAAASGTSAPINYGSGTGPQTVEAIQENMGAKLVKSFWKGMDRMSKTGKPFKIAPHGGTDVIEFRPDRIIFEDQVLHATNMLISVPEQIYTRIDTISRMRDESNRLYDPFSLASDNEPQMPDAVRQWLAEHHPKYLNGGCKQNDNEFREHVQRRRHIDVNFYEDPRVREYRTNIEVWRAAKKLRIHIGDKALRDIIEVYRPNTYRTISPDVSSPLGFMFWRPEGQEDTNTYYDSHAHAYLHQVSIFRQWMQSFFLSEKVKALNLTNYDIAAIALTRDIASAYVDYRGKDPEGADWLNPDPIAGPDDLDFNTITEKFVECVCLPFTVVRRAHDFFKMYIAPQLPTDTTVTLCQAIVGQVRCKIQVVLTGEKRTTRWMFNGVKVRRDEILSIMKRAMCFQEQSAYDAFIKQVGAISLRARDLMANGLSVNIRIDRYQKSRTVPVLLEFGKDSRQWQLLVRNPDGSVFKTHDLEGGATRFVNALASQEKARRQGDTRQKEIASNDFIDMMKSVPSLGAESLRRLLATGLKVVDERFARSRALMENAVNMVKAEYISHTYGSKTLSGYKVTGVSGKSYLVCCDRVSGKKGTTNNHGDDKFGAVYALPNLQYVCIVDKSHDQTGYDIIVNRLLALKNDRHVAGSVTTLNRYTNEE